MERKWLCIFCVFVMVLFCACREPASQESTDNQTTSTATKVTTVNTTTTAQTKHTTKQTTTSQPIMKFTSAQKTTTGTTAWSISHLPEWKQLYVLQGIVEADTYDSFMLLHIDDDNIPEVFLDGKDGHMMRAYRNKGLWTAEPGIVQQPLNKDNGVYYIPKSGRFMNVYAEGDHMVMKVYEITNDRGFVEIFRGYEYANGTEREYYLNNPKGGTAPLTPADFLTELDKVFVLSSAVSLKDDLLPFEQFDKQVREWK